MKQEKLFWSENKFDHNWINVPKLQRLDLSEGRKYITPNGAQYESVTTFLGKLSREEIDAWRNAIGNIEADKISKRAADRGTKLHTNIENYLRNKEVLISKIDLVSLDLMKSVIPQLNNISNIRILEGQIYSTRLKLAGTVDCVADWCNVPSVIDFKSSTKLKDKETISNYFLQTCFYSLMLSDQFNMQFKQLVVIIANEFGHPTVFVEQRSDWIKKCVNLVQQYQ